MAKSVTLGGVSYNIPALGESGWGVSVTNYLIAISNNVLKKDGGTLTLTAEANFGDSYGLKSKYYKSNGSLATNQPGVVRLANGEEISWARNASGYKSLRLNSANILELYDSSTATSTPIVSIPLGTGNQVLGVNSAGTANEYKTISGTTNQVNVVHAANSITLSTPQDIATTSRPTFAGVKLADAGTSKILVSDGSGNVISSGIDASQLNNLNSSGLSTGTGGLVYNTNPVITNPTLTTPNIGAATGTSLQLSSLTESKALVSDASKNIVSSAVTATELSYLSGATGTTGSGKLVRDGSPTLVTPNIGAATATTINKVTITPVASGATLTLADGVTVQFSSGFQFTGTGGSSVNLDQGGAVAYKNKAKLNDFAATTSGELSTVIQDATGKGPTNNGNLVFNREPLLINPSVNQISNAAVSPSVVLTLPTVADTLIGRISNDTGANRLKNKDLEDSTVIIVDSSDTTKKFAVDVAGTSGTKTTLLTSQTADRTITLPDDTTTLVGTATPQTLLNKATISSTDAITGALQLPSGTTGQQPSSATSGMIRYNTSTSSFEGYVSGAWAGIGGGGTTDKITQNAHGLDVGDAVYLNGGTYTKAIASAANTAEVVGVVSRKVDANNFELTLSGEITVNTTLVAGTVYFLSPTTAGALTATEPTIIGQVSVPVGVASSTSTLYVAPKRGVIVGGVNARTSIPLANNATTATQQITDYDAGEITGWIFLSGTPSYRFQISIQFAKNGTGSDYNVAYQTVGDTPPSGFAIGYSSPNITITVPNGGFSSGVFNYALNAPAVGATFPLAVDAATITTGTPAFDTINERTSTNGVQVKGRTNGVAIPAGYIGETLGTLRSGTGGSAYTFRATTAFDNTATSLVSATLNKGIYLVSCAAQVVNNSGSARTVKYWLAIGGTQVTNDFNMDVGAGGTMSSLCLPSTPVVIISDSAIVDMKGQFATSGLSSAHKQELTIIRIA